LVQEVKDEFKARKGTYQYEGLVPPGPPPVGQQ